MSVDLVAHIRTNTSQCNTSLYIEWAHKYIRLGHPAATFHEMGYDADSAT
jgi:hypothetical protein